jgi:transposase
VDVAKDEVVVAVWDREMQTAQVLPPFSNDEAGWEQLAHQIEGWTQSQPQRTGAAGAAVIHLTAEPTGGYELPLAYFAHQRGWQVSLVNPLRLRDWARSQGRRAKTDRLDAAVLAHYTVERRPPAWQPPSPALRELDNLLSRRADLQKMLQAERNRQKQFTLRPDAQTISHNVQFVLAALEQALADIDAALADWRDRYPPLDEQADLLDTLPGVGPQTVLRLMAVLIRWSILTGGRDPDQTKPLTAFVGLDPQVHTSGISVYKRPLISKQGDPELRMALYMAVLGALRGRNALHDFYDALVARGKPKMVALVACMRKLLIWAWRVFITHTPYDPSLHLKPS